MQQPTQPHMPPDLKAYTHDNIPRDATWFMDGYWPSVQFAVDDMPIAWVCESGRVALQGRLWNRGVFR